jgi:hypothetical protein
MIVLKELNSGLAEQLNSHQMWQEKIALKLVKCYCLITK